MASPSARFASGKYTGNGSASAQVFKTQFKPSKLQVRSAEGEVVFMSHMHAPWAAIDGAKPIYLAAGAVAFDELQFSIASAADSINKSAVVYYWEAFE
jgi:hypothetical protein